MVQFYLFRMIGLFTCMLIRANLLPNDPVRKREMNPFKTGWIPNIIPTTITRLEIYFIRRIRTDFQIFVSFIIQ